MTEHETLARMIVPGTPRPGAYRTGILQIHITRACDRACFNCTQGSNLRGKTYFMSLEDFEIVHPDYTSSARGVARRSTAYNCCQGIA